MSHTHVKNASLVFAIPINGTLTQLAVPGSIYSMIRSDNGKSLKQLCPDCEQPIKLDVNCANNHGPIDRSTLLSGQIVTEGETTKIVVVENAKEVKESDIAKGKLSLTAVTRESLIEGTVPFGKPYHFMPTPADTEEKEAYDILYSAITDNPDWAFVCRANIGRGAETLISVESGAFGGLTLQTLSYPETLYDLPEYEVTPLSKSNKAGVRTLVETRVEEFDPEKWIDRQATAIGEAVAAASKVNRKGGKPKAKKVKDTTPTLLSAIADAAKKAS